MKNSCALVSTVHTRTETPDFKESGIFSKMLYQVFLDLIANVHDPSLDILSPISSTFGNLEFKAAFIEDHFDPVPFHCE